MALTTYQVITKSPNGVLTMDSSGSSVFVPNPNYIGTSTGTYGIYCDGILTSTATWTVTTTGICNTAFTIKAVKNDCLVGAPSSINYNVLANTVCNKATIAEANWEAYLQSLSIAQVQANLGLCIQCVIPPCVIICGPGKVTISGYPNHRFRIYNNLTLLLEIQSGPTGVVTIENPNIIGELYITQVDALGNESPKQCETFKVLQNCETSYTVPSTSDCGCN